MKTTTFLIIFSAFVLLIIWQAIHPERANDGHFIVTVLLAITALSVWPFGKKKLPRLSITKRLRWEVDYWGIFVEDITPMKFYTEKVAQAYFTYICGTVYEKKGITRMFPLTPDRANNPINVITTKKMTLSNQMRYVNRKRKDGRERTFRPNAENCTSLLGKRDIKKASSLTHEYRDARNL